MPDDIDKTVNSDEFVPSEKKDSTMLYCVIGLFVFLVVCVLLYAIFFSKPRVKAAPPPIVPAPRGASLTDLSEDPRDAPPADTDTGEYEEITIVEDVADPENTFTPVQT